jgi:hypothetical protein
VPLESKVRLGRPVLKVRKAVLVSQASQARPVPKALLVSRGHRVHKDLPDLQEQRGLKAPLESKAQLVIRDLKVRRDRQVSQA